MSEDLFAKYRGVIYFSLVVVTLVTFYPLFQSGFGATDDVQNYMVYHLHAVKNNALYLARLAGRFYYLFLHPVYMLPYVFGSMFVVKLFHHVPIVLGVILFAVILYRMVRSKELAFLFFLVFLATAQATRHASLLLAFPFFFTFSFNLLLLSFLFLIRYFETDRRAWLVWSVVLYSVSILFSESYLPYLLIFLIGISILAYRKESSVRILVRKSLLTILPYVAATLAYLIAYVLYRVYHPSQYPGTSMGSGTLTLGAVLNTIWKISITSYPLTGFADNRPMFYDRSLLIGGYTPVVLDILLHARVEWILKGICLAFCGYLFLYNGRGISYKTFLAGMLIGILVIFLPNLPLAFTAKYIKSASINMIGYVPTYFSIFGSALVISLVLIFLTGLLERIRVARMVLSGLFVGVLFVVSVLTDFNNYTVAQDLKASNLRLEATQELAKYNSFRAIPSNAILWADGMTKTASWCAPGIVKRDFQWATWFSICTGKNYRSYNKYEDIPVSTPDNPEFVYPIFYRQPLRSQELMLVLTKLRPKMSAEQPPQQYVHKVWILYYSPNRAFTVSFRTKCDSVPQKEVLVNWIKFNLKNDNQINLTVFNPARNTPGTFFTITADSIDLKSIMISDIVDPQNTTYYL